MPPTGITKNVLPNGALGIIPNSIWQHQCIRLEAVSKPFPTLATWVILAIRANLSREGDLGRRKNVFPSSWMSVIYEFFLCLSAVALIIGEAKVNIVLHPSGSSNIYREKPCNNSLSLTLRFKGVVKYAAMQSVVVSIRGLYTAHNILISILYRVGPNFMRQKNCPNFAVDFQPLGASGDKIEPSAENLFTSLSSFTFQTFAYIRLPPNFHSCCPETLWPWLHHSGYICLHTSQCMPPNEITKNVLPNGALGSMPKQYLTTSMYSIRSSINALPNTRYFRVILAIRANLSLEDLGRRKRFSPPLDVGYIWIFSMFVSSSLDYREKRRLISSCILQVHLIYIGRSLVITACN